MASPSFQFCPFKRKLFIHGCACSSLLLVFSLLVAAGGRSLVVVSRLPVPVASLTAEHGLQGMQALAAAVLGLQSTSSVAVVPGFSYSTTVGASQSRDPSRVSCIGRWVLYHLATGKPFHFVKWYQSAQRRSAVYLLPWRWSETGLTCTQCPLLQSGWTWTAFWACGWTPE